MALGTATDSEVGSLNVVQDLVNDSVTISRFERERVPIELLSRVTIGKLEGSLRPELGVEIAYNRLDSSIALEIEDAAGVTPIELPASDVTVEGLRGEAFGNVIWLAAKDWTIEAGLAVETSRISVDGDATAQNSFTFIKPSLALTHQVSKALQLRAGLRRTVGQLDFNDFAASANIEDDRLLAGNPDLGPDQTTRGSFTADFRAPSGAALNIEVFHEWRSDVLEQIVLPSGVGGLANAGSARVWGLDVEAALPLRAILRGGLIEVDGEFRRSSFDDPITGTTREIFGLQDRRIDITLRQDLTPERIAYGVTYEPSGEFSQFFTGEIINETRGDRWTAFVETTRFFGVKMQLEVRNIGRTLFPRERFLFTPDRSGALAGSEILDRRRGEFVKFTVTDQF